MIDFRPHRVWIGIMALAVLIGAGNAPVIGIAEQKAEQKRAALQVENEKALDTLRQMREDILAVEKMKTVIDDAAAKEFLAPVDRLRAAQILERRAAESGLTHFTYTLFPEEKTSLDTSSAGKQELATSKWTLAADAPTDLDAYVFLDAIGRTLPGHITLRQITLQRIGAKDAPITEANVHLAASGEWLSNGAVPNPVEEKQ